MFALEVSRIFLELGTIKFGKKWKRTKRSEEEEEIPSHK